MDRTKLQFALESAVGWLQDTAINRDHTPIGTHGADMTTTFWRGAVRGEYRAATREWGCLCPIWHTGQAVKALALAGLMGEARFCAGFILANQRDDGLILAFEDHADAVNTSAILESLDGLLLLPESKYRQAAIAALEWVAANAWVPEKKHFNDVYDPDANAFRFNVRGAQGRPLLDDAMFIKGWRLTGRQHFLDIALATAETLLADEAPAGNWVKYIPCNAATGSIHPRQAYWWGLPMLEVYRETGDERHRNLFIRSVEWYRQAMRRDGGLFRGTDTDFNTDSFGHATSGVACAVIAFIEYRSETGDDSITPYIEIGLEFCMRMQFTKTSDRNLMGAILEKVLPPDGTDNLPYQLRDLGTIFFIQAAAKYLAEV